MRVPRGPRWAHYHAAEKKVADIGHTNYGASTTAVFTLLNGIAVGDDITNRDGRRVHLKSLFIRGFVGPEDSNTTFQLARLLVVYDKQANGGTPVTTDVLNTATATAPMNLNNRERFKVILDRQYVMGHYDVASAAPAAPIAASPTCHSVYLWKPLREDTIYNTTTGVISAIATGSLWMITIGSSVAGQGSIFQLSIRLRFVDE